MLTSDEVRRFARRWLRKLLGERFAGTFLFVGGAFKTLLHGRSPRDIDLWPVGEANRKRILQRLEERGAELVDDNKPYQQAFAMGDATVELAYSSEHETLDACFAGFDIGLAAVGARWDHGNVTTAIHPLARKSVNAEEILLIRNKTADPVLPNWKYALDTLERMYRYADELGYDIPPSEVETIWRVFETQSQEMQEGMLERYRRVSAGQFGIEREARRRL